MSLCSWLISLGLVSVFFAGWTKNIYLSDKVGLANRLVWCLFWSIRFTTRLIYHLHKLLLCVKNQDSKFPVVVLGTRSKKRKVCCPLEHVRVIINKVFRLWSCFAHVSSHPYWCTSLCSLIDSYGGYILESFVSHSIKKQRNTKGKKVQKKEKKPHQKKKERKKRKVIFFQKCLHPI